MVCEINLIRDAFIGCDADMTCDAADVEYVRFRIRGQSFMLNQIRHMIGVLVDMARGSAPAWKLDLSLNSVLMKLPLAPATGLFLHHVSSVCVCTNC